MVSSPPAAPRGGLSVNYIQSGLCTAKTSAGCRSSLTIPFPPHHQLDPDRYSQPAWTRRNQKRKENPQACGDGVLLSVCLLVEEEAAAAAVPPHLQFSHHMLWTSQQQGRRRGWEVWKQQPAELLRFELKGQNWDGRQSRERERGGWQTAFHGLSGWDTLFPVHTVSH